MYGAERNLGGTCEEAESRGSQEVESQGRGRSLGTGVVGGGGQASRASAAQACSRPAGQAPECLHTLFLRGVDPWCLLEARALVVALEDSCIAPGRAAAVPGPGDRRLPELVGPAWSSFRPRTTTSCSRASVPCGAAGATAACSSDRPLIYFLPGTPFVWDW